MSAATTAKRVAALNDALRSHAGSAWLPKSFEGSGNILVTAGINALSPEEKLEVLHRVATFDSFDRNNNQHGERDFGAFEVSGVGKVFWKIDYYADATCTYGSEDPSDPARSFRVLTIMLAEEY